MKKAKSITVGLLASVLLFTTNLAIAIEPIPKESGFSSFVNLGTVYLSVKSNMVAGNDLADVGKRTIDSIFDSPDSESEVLPLLNGELRYTLASTRTQLFIGTLLEDYLRPDLATQSRSNRQGVAEHIVNQRCQRLALARGAFLELL